jgi:hypothetical protein
MRLASHASMQRMGKGSGRYHAQYGIAADRFAREIVRFLMHSSAARSRQLNAKPFGAL